jgi:hypothetical protein
MRKYYINPITIISISFYRRDNMDIEGLSIDGLKIWDEGVDEYEIVIESSVDSDIEYISMDSFMRSLNHNIEILIDQSLGNTIL